MIRTMIPGTNKGLTIDNETRTLSTTRLDNDIVTAMPLLGHSTIYLVWKTDGEPVSAYGKAETIKAFLIMADAYSDNAYAFISERFI